MARLQFAVVLFLVTVQVAVCFFALKSSFTPSFSSSTSLQAAPVTARDVKFNVPGGTVSYDLSTYKDNDEHPLVYLPGLIREKNDAQSINLQSLCKKVPPS